MEQIKKTVTGVYHKILPSSTDQQSSFKKFNQVTPSNDFSLMIEHVEMKRDMPNGSTGKKKHTY